MTMQWKTWTVAILLSAVGSFSQAAVVVDFNALGNEGDPADQWKNELAPSTYARTFGGSSVTPVLTSGTASGSPVTFYRNADGGAGGGFKSAGSGSEVSVTGITDWTYEIWLRRTHNHNSDGNGEAHISRWGNIDADSGGGGSWFALDQSNHYAGANVGLDATKFDYFMLPGFHNNPDDVVGLPIVDAADGPFSQLLFTWDDSAGELKVYQNSTLERTHDFSGHPGWSDTTPNNDWDIFVNDIPSRSFPGDISMVRLHDEMLDQAGVTTAFNAGPNAPEPSAAILLVLGLICGGISCRNRK